MRFILLLFFTLTLFLNSKIIYEKRKALLIGNWSYQYISKLDNPMFNLNRLKKVLENLDFDVEIKKNLNSEELESAIDNFASELSTNSKNIGFIYYTGHGCQVDYQGYLIPVNVNTKYKLKIKYNALNINKILEILERAGNRVNMIFLDACRDVPTGTKGGTKGLGQPIRKPKGSLIVYATEAGKVANDNSKFINSLIDNLSKPNQSIRNIGDNISNEVAQMTSYTQIPEVYTKLLPLITLEKKDKMCTKTIPIPPKYRTVTKRFLSTDSFKMYIWKENGITKKLAPKTKVVTKRILVSYGTEKYITDGIKYKKVKIPPIYKTVKVTKVVEDVDISEIPSSNYKVIPVPAKYRVVRIKELVEPSKLKTISVPCNR